MNIKLLVLPGGYGVVKAGLTTALLCFLLCSISFFWLLFITRKFNFSGFFYLMYYFFMYPVLCVIIFGLYLKGMLRYRYYIVFLLGVAVGLLVGSVSWIFSMILSEYGFLFWLLNYGFSGFFEVIFFHVLISSVATFDFLIGAVSAVLVKYLWCESKVKEYSCN